MIKKNIIYVTLLSLVSIYPIAIAQTPSTDTSTSDTSTPNPPPTTEKPYERDDVYRQIELFSTALSFVLNNYYQNLTKEQLDEIMSDAIKGMLQGLGDRYSFYQAETSRKREQENLFFAKFGGLGIRILPSPDGFISIVQAMDGTPAMKAGLHAGDKILAVDGKSIENQSIEDVVEMIRGEVGTKVNLTLVRPGMDTSFDVAVTREIINYPSVKSILIEGQIGYIAISDFTAETATEMYKSIVDLKGEGMRGLILDLRNNPGGMLTSAVDVSNAFIPEGLIVSTDGRLDRFDSEYRADSKKMIYPADMPLVLLVNDNSASGSEIVAGAIKDYKRGLLIGEKTFGKGVVQQRFPLDEQRAVSITVSIYKTPNGTWIHERTLFTVPLELQKELDEGKIPESLRQEFTNKGITLSQESTVKVKDKIRDKGIKWQINDGKAVYTIKRDENKLKVTQGGVPVDIEVEQPNLLGDDKDGEIAKMFTKFYEGEYTNKFVYDYIDKHQDQSPEEQLKGLEETIPELMKTLADNGITLNQKLVTMYVKRTLSSTRNIPNIDLENDVQLARAVEEIKKQIK
jgi:carboxyl-terminal processing protease